MTSFSRYCIAILSEILTFNLEVDVIEIKICPRFLEDVPRVSTWRTYIKFTNFKAHLPSCPAGWWQYLLGVKSMLCQVENMWPSWLNVLFNQFCSICLNLRRHHSHTLQNSLYCFYQHSLQSPSQFPFPIILVQVHLDFIFQRKGFLFPPQNWSGSPRGFLAFSILNSLFLSVTSIWTFL